MCCDQGEPISKPYPCILRWVDAVAVAAAVVAVAAVGYVLRRDGAPNTQTLIGCDRTTSPQGCLK